MIIYIIATAMAAVALAFVLPRLLSRRSVRRAPDEHADESPSRTSSRTIATAVAIAIALPLAAFGLYAAVGDPRAASDTRVIDDAPASVAAELERHLAQHPRDARGRVLLARMRMDEDRFAEAAASYEMALASPKVAADAGVWCEYADALGMAQGGSLAGKPTELIAKALTLDPANPKALEMAGSAAYERRDFAAAARHWRALLQSMPADAAARTELAAAVARAERQE